MIKILMHITAILMLSTTAFGQNIKPNDTSTNTTIKDSTTKVIIRGSRSKTDILKVIMANLAAVRYVYNQRLKDKPRLEGKIIIRFTIDQFGDVVYCNVDSSSMHDDILENKFTHKIRTYWKFGKIDKLGDITEVVYPFVFTVAKIKSKNDIGIVTCLFSVLLMCGVLILLVITHQK
jgi:hypothetical protein